MSFTRWCSDSEQQVPTVEETPLETAEGTSIPEVEKPKAESEEDKYVDFTEWQKTQKQKRAQMLQDKLTTVAGSARPVDAADIEKDGYLLYAREETKEEREAREARMHQDEESTDSDEEKDPQRPKTVSRPRE